MTKIQKVVRDIENLQDFYKKNQVIEGSDKEEGLGT
jgi:hypothetical protein